MIRYKNKGLLETSMNNYIPQKSDNLADTDKFLFVLIYPKVPQIPKTLLLQASMRHYVRWLLCDLGLFYISFTLEHSPSFPMSLSSLKKLGSESWRTCHTLNKLQSHFLSCEPPPGQLGFPEVYRLILWTLCIVSLKETGACIICAHTTLLLPWIHLEPQAIAFVSRRSLMDFQGELKRRVVFPQSRETEA